MTKIAIVIFNHFLDTLSSKRGQPSGNVQRIVMIESQIVIKILQIIVQFKERV